MPLSFGGNNIGNVYYGNNVIKEIYHGSDKVWSKVQPSTDKLLIYSKSNTVNTVYIVNSDLSGFTSVDVGYAFTDIVYIIGRGYYAFSANTTPKSIGAEGSYFIYSPDGTTWTKYDVVYNNTYANIWSICTYNNELCLFSNKNILTSSDMTNWVYTSVSYANIGGSGVQNPVKHAIKKNGMYLGIANYTKTTSPVTTYSSVEYAYENNITTWTNLISGSKVNPSHFVMDMKDDYFYCALITTSSTTINGNKRFSNPVSSTVDITKVNARLDNLVTGVKDNTSYLIYIYDPNSTTSTSSGYGAFKVSTDHGDTVLNTSLSNLSTGFDSSSTKSGYLRYYATCLYGNLYALENAISSCSGLYVTLHKKALDQITTSDWDPNPLQLFEHAGDKTGWSFPYISE